MPELDRFAPPSNLDDLTDEHVTAWSRFLSNYFDRSKAGAPGANDGPRKQFVHMLKEDFGGAYVEAIVTWSAFPRQVTISTVGNVQRWKRADSARAYQDEYCEWSVHRDDSGRITRVAFTSEGPEYWQALAHLQPDTVVELYRKHISEEVQKSDLFTNGEYDPHNRWNSGTEHGAMHLIQRNNTLGAEIELAAGASTVRRRDGQLVSETQQLIRCGAYGAEERHSDPHIGAEVNKLTREGRRVSLANPVGLFIEGIDLEEFVMPSAEVRPEDCWTVERGGNRAVRAVFAVPDGVDFTVTDIAIGDRRIEYGGQIADKFTIGLAAWASESTDALAVVDGCVRFAEMARGDALVDAIGAGQLRARRR